LNRLQSSAEESEEELKQMDDYVALENKIEGALDVRRAILGKGQKGG